MLLFHPFPLAYNCHTISWPVVSICSRDVIGLTFCVCFFVLSRNLRGKALLLFLYIYKKLKKQNKKQQLFCFVIVLEKELCPLPLYSLPSPPRSSVQLFMYSPIRVLKMNLVQLVCDLSLKLSIKERTLQYVQELFPPPPLLPMVNNVAFHVRTH